MKKRLLLESLLVLSSIAGGRVALAESKNQDNWQFNERYRNQYHYSAKQNWLNDPNGLLYDDSTGVYHMFYQYNPEENFWGHMSWGHATSTDMINWQEQAVAIPEMTAQPFTDFTYTNTEGDLKDVGEVRYIGTPTTNWGEDGENGRKYVFSGSAIQDKNNVTGLGENTILAYFTSCYQIATRKNDGAENGLGSWLGFKEVQEQHLAYSTDGGQTFQHYDPDQAKAGIQPIIPVTMMPHGDAKDFRDPKVVFDEEHNQWLMVLVAGQEAQIFRSTNLLDWEYTSAIKREHDVNVGVWECPELIPMKVEGSQETKWILTMSVQDNAYASGSGMQYMVGELDADGNWVPENNQTLSDPEWLDFGEDFYAGVTFNNVANDRKVMLAWMSNWKYVNEQKTTPWYSHMTVPRELTLVANAAFDDGYQLIQKPIAEFDSLKETAISLPDQNLSNEQVKVDQYQGTNYQIEAEFSWENTDKPTSVGMFLRGSDDLSRKLVVGYDLNTSLAFVNRMGTGEPNLGAPRDKMNTYIDPSSQKIKLSALVDESSIEVFINDGERTITQVFYFRPELIGNIATDSLAFYAENGKAHVTDAVITPIRSIFGELAINDTKQNISVGDQFDPIAHVTATNTKGDGTQEDLNNQLQILQNSVDTSTAGTYEVLFGLQNSLGKYFEQRMDFTVVANEVAAESIALDVSGVKTLKKGKSLTVTPQISPANATTTLTWTVSNPKVAQVEGNSVNAVGIGTTQITVSTENGKKASFVLRVTA